MKKIIVLMLLSLLPQALQAKPLQIDGTVMVTVNATETGEPLEFELPTFKIPRHSLDALKQRFNQYQKFGSEPVPTYPDLPRKVYVGMEGTPVLNQGKHGSCVTFAITGALDALLGAGDYISQLCNLELGTQLAMNDKQPYGGWKGNYGTLVLQQIDQYGVNTQQHQKLHGCAGVKDYPLKDPNDTGKPMSVAEFKKHRVDISKLYTWEVLLFDEGWLHAPDMNDLLLRVKKELAQGNKINVGMLLDVKLGHAGAMGMYHVLNDTWMITPQVIYDANQGIITAGHDMVVIGYDDDAVTIDENGHTNRGLIYLRNSWSDKAGDNGNYYVSYDYFKIMTEEVHLIKLR